MTHCLLPLFFKKELALVAGAEELDAAVWLFAATARDQVVARGHLVLQAADVGVGRGQFRRRQSFVENLVDDILGLKQGAHGFVIRAGARITIAIAPGLVLIEGIRGRDVEDVGESVLHLGNGVIFQNDDRLIFPLGLLQPFRLMAVIVFQRHNGVGVGLAVGDDDRHAQVAGGLSQAIAAHAEGVDAQRFDDGCCILLVSLLVVLADAPVGGAFGGDQRHGGAMLNIGGRRASRGQFAEHGLHVHRSNAGSAVWRAGSRCRAGRAHSHFKRHYLRLGCVATSKTVGAGVPAIAAASIARLALSYLAKLIPVAAPTLEAAVAGAGARQAACPPHRDFHAAGRDAAHGDAARLLVAGALLGDDRLAAQHVVDRIGYVAVDDQLFPALLLHYHVEGWRGLALKDALLRMAASGLLIAQRDGLNAAHQIGERRVDQQVAQRVTVCRRDQLHAAFGDGASGCRFQFRANFVDDDDLRHVVFDRFDHHRVLFCRARHLHAARASYSRVRNITITRDFIGCINHHYPFIGLVGQNTGYFTQQGGFTHARATKYQDRLTLLDDIANQRDAAQHRTTNTTGQTHNFPLAVPQGANTMQGALNPGAVIVAEFTNTLDHVFEVRVGDRLRTQDHLPFWEPALGIASEVHYDLQQFAPVFQAVDCIVDVWRKSRQQSLQIVSDHVLHRQSYHLIVWRALTVPRPLTP